VLEDDVDHYVHCQVLRWLSYDNIRFAVKTGLKINVDAAKIMLEPSGNSYRTLNGECELYFRENGLIEIRANGNAKTYKQGILESGSNGVGDVYYPWYKRQEVTPASCEMECRNMPVPANKPGVNPSGIWLTQIREGV